MRLTRRRLLSGAAGVAGAGLAGCLGDESADGAAGTTATASFFVFGDILTQVAGESAEASLLVPIGQHGHGWEPGPSVRQEIRGADLFVHGMPGFQPWVDDITGDLTADDADVTTVDASAGVNMLAAGGGGHDHSGEESGSDHEEHDHQEEGSHDEQEHDQQEEGSHDHEQEHDHQQEGSHDHQQEGSHEGHDHGAMDPHFWMDPLRVKTAVGTVQQGLADIDPDNAAAYADNAEEYRRALDTLHEQLTSVVEAGSNEVMLVAGHNAFQYFSDRYGVRVEALTNVSPDDRPTLRDIERAQGIIDSHDLQYICADPLESQQAAEQLVAETSAEAVLPLTAMPGLTDEWERNDWGYVEVMENVNIPTLERVLDA